MRLVFAPEFDAAFIGRDTDNFVYLRYDLDISFFRICENDKPVPSRPLPALVANQGERE